MLLTLSSVLLYHAGKVIYLSVYCLSITTKIDRSEDWGIRVVMLSKFENSGLFFAFSRLVVVTNVVSLVWPRLSTTCTPSTVTRCFHCVPMLERNKVRFVKPTWLATIVSHSALACSSTAKGHTVRVQGMCSRKLKFSVYWVARFIVQHHFVAMCACSELRHCI